MRVTEELRKPGVKRMILDTDTYNEIDDQFALSLAMLAPDKIDLDCVTAAPFEIGVVAGLTAKSHGVKIPPYYKGAKERMPDEKTPVISEASEKIAECVMEYEGTTFVTAIGAITNVASAILSHPEIRNRIAVIWLAGNAKWFDGAEFNMLGDTNASNALLSSGVPLLLFPCGGVVTHLSLSIYELEHFLRGNSPLGDYLCDIFAACRPEGAVAWSRVVWDISTVCGVVDPGSFSASPCPAMRLNPDRTYAFDPAGVPFEHVDRVNRDRIFSALFGRLAK